MKRLLSILMVICLMVTMLPLNALAASKDYIEVTKDNAPLRSGKAEKYSVVARATKGTILKVIRSSYNGYLNKWYEVETASGSAYIYSGNVKEVSASGFTKNIKISETKIELNTKGDISNGDKSKTLKAICEYKSRTDSNVTWSSSDTKVATVDSSGKVTAKNLGTCKITAQHKIYGTKATCQISVVEQIVYEVKAKEQSNEKCCAGASAYALLTYFKGNAYKKDVNKTDVQLWNMIKDRNSKRQATIGNIANVVNSYLGKNHYKCATYTSQRSFEQAVINSIQKGYPVVALVKINSDNYYKYKTNGHFTVISGYEINNDGTVDFRIADSYKINKNGGTFWVPAKEFFKYSKAHNPPYYLMLKK